MKRMVTPVIVNIHSEMGKLPAKIQEATPGGSYPYVILADPAMTKIYGVYNHAKLKVQNYRDIFRDAKRAASNDIKGDTFNTDLDAPKAEEKPEEQVAKKSESSTSSPKPAPVESKKDIIKIENPEMKNWTSSCGSKIEAKLMGVEDKTTFVFVTSAGKTLRVTGDQLSLDSLTAAKKLAGLGN